MRRVTQYFAVAALLANLLVVTAGGGAATADVAAYLDPLLQSALTTASPSESLVVVAELPDVPSETDLALLRATGVAAVGYTRLPMAALEGTPAQINAVAALPLVRSLWLNHGLQAALHESTAQIGATAVHTDYGVTGRGIGVAVLDSGIDGFHPDVHYPDHTVQNVKLLGDQHVFADLTFAVEDVADTDTTTGHGTHVAGIVAGSGDASNGYYTGVAPGANLIGVGAADGLDMLTALAGYDWILAHRTTYNIRVVNNSWADDTVAYDANDPLNQASLRAYQSGITVVFAAGNDGQSSGNVFNRYAWPAWVVSSGAVDKNSVLASYSSRGDAAHHPDLVAPGSYIASARAITGVVTDANSTPLDLTDPSNPRMVAPEYDAYYTITVGTSMAAPHVAGVAALMLEANPALTVDQVHSLLVSTATPVAGCAVVDCGAGVVNALAAVRAARDAVAPPTAVVDAPAKAKSGQSVTLDASGSSDPDGRIVGYTFDFGDGTSVTTTVPTASHVYRAGWATWLTWRVTVTDGAGLTGTASGGIKITP